MEGYEFIVSIVQSIVARAWRALGATAVRMFRGKIPELLPRSRLKSRDLDVSFRLDQAEQAAAELKTVEPHLVPERTRQEKEKFVELVELSPRAAILDRGRELENAVESFAQSLGMFPSRMSGLLDLTRELRNNELIDRATAALLDDLRAVRNSAAQAREIDISARQALRFAALTDTAIRQFRRSAEAAPLLRHPPRDMQKSP